jgi:hypothetical protein
MRYACAVVALAICSGCGGASSVTPSNAAVVDGSLSATDVRGSSSKTYEYVTSIYNDKTSIFNYPNGDRQIGSMNAPGGMGCTNVLYGYGKDRFWVVGSNELVEYRVLKKRVRSISVSSGFLSGCAMNTKGDLAAGVLAGSDGGDVIIFKNARGSGTVYSTGLSRAGFLGYDPKGDLFADGFNADYKFTFVELPSGSKTFRAVTVSNSVLYPGSVQWDGTYLDITDQDASVMYQYAVSGTEATLKGSVSLSGASDCAETWIAAGVVFCADAGNNAAVVYQYPAGGSPIATLSGNIDLPLGVVAVAK